MLVTDYLHLNPHHTAPQCGVDLILYVRSTERLCRLDSYLSIELSNLPSLPPIPSVKRLIILLIPLIINAPLPSPLSIHCFLPDIAAWIIQHGG